MAIKYFSAVHTSLCFEQINLVCRETKSALLPCLILGLFLEALSNAYGTLHWLGGELIGDELGEGLETAVVVHSKIVDWELCDTLRVIEQRFEPEISEIQKNNSATLVLLWRCCFFRRVQDNCEKRVLASSCLSVCLSVCPHGTTRLPLDSFPWNLIFKYFSKICRENSSFIEIWQE